MSVTIPPELETLKKCDTHLISTLDGNIDRALVNFLAQQGFIKEDLRQEIIEPISSLNPKEKAGKLVEGIRNAVSLDSKKYHILISYFEGGGAYYEAIVEIMTKQFKELKEKKVEKSLMPNDQDRSIHSQHNSYTPSQQNSQRNSSTLSQQKYSSTPSRSKFQETSIIIDPQEPTTAKNKR